MAAFNLLRNTPKRFGYNLSLEWQGMATVPRRHRIVRHAPIFLIEVFSPEDSMKSLHERVGDYVRMGVQHI